MAEQFIRIKHEKRIQLNYILNKVYSKPPTSIKFHQLLANIPHIKTIITTNYDKLFELAYRNDAMKIVESSDIGKIDGRYEIIKVHSILNFPGSLIISKSD